MNNFEYVEADGSGDPKGILCPVGAHIRRVNPRGQPVSGQGLPGGSNNSHRFIRRRLPYGPTYDRTKPYDGMERGMLFHFINSKSKTNMSSCFDSGSTTASSPVVSGFTRSRKIR